jgi:hypothetical protein
MWSPNVGLQGLTPNHPKLLRPKAVVVSDRENTDTLEGHKLNCLFAGWDGAGERRDHAAIHMCF